MLKLKKGIQKQPEVEVNKCYVCGKPETKKNPLIYIGQGKHRHSKCSVGSSNWMKYRTNSPLYKYFKGGNND